MVGLKVDYCGNVYEVTDIEKDTKRVVLTDVNDCHTIFIRYAQFIEEADIFEKHSDDSFLPDGYAEIEYSDFDSAEAIEGAKFDDMNYLRYLER